jgi:hypothetical protein
MEIQSRGCNAALMGVYIPEGLRGILYKRDWMTGWVLEDN